MKKLLTLLGLAMALIVGAAQAQITNPFTGTYTWSTNGGSNNVTNFPYNGAAISDVTVGDAVKVGVTTSSNANNFRGSAWPTNAALDAGHYLEFSLTATTGTLNISNITFGIGRSGTGPVNWEWRSSVDSYGSALTNYSSLNAGLTLTNGVITNPDSNSGWTGNVLNLSGGTFDGLSNVTFRFYGYSSEANAGTGGFQGPLSFSGASVVPEPTSLAMIGLTGLGFAGYVIRRRRR